VNENTLFVLLTCLWFWDMISTSDSKPNLTLNSSYTEKFQAIVLQMAVNIKVYIILAEDFLEMQRY